MNEKNWLAENFEANRTHLRGVAYRMLGSRPEAEDAVQEAWLRFSRADTSDVKNVGGWLTTIVARICLDMLRARKARREEALAEEGGIGETSSESTTGDDATHPEHEVLMADSVGLALLVVLETLSPAERVAFVLHDMFDLPFEEIAPIVGRTPSATRQLASRARRRVQGAPTIPPPGRTRQSEIVRAFLAASREGDFEALLALLDPEVVFRADPVAVRRGAQAEIRGAPAVAETFKGRAQGAQPALVDGEVGVAVAPGGQLRIVLRLAISNERITSITAIADPASIRQLDVEMLDV